MRILIFFLLLGGLSLSVNAQPKASLKTDTLSKVKRTSVSKRDTIQKKVAEPVIVKDSARLAIERMPHDAALRSALLPGLGQIYNKRWWKVPFVYSGFVAIGLAYEFNQRHYKEFLGEVQYRSEHDNKPKNPKYAGYSFEGMVRVKDAYRRDRDLSILGLVLMHAVNIIDAYVDAKFFRYDISDDLGFSIQPTVQKPYAFTSPAYGIKLNLAL